MEYDCIKTGGQALEIQSETGPTRHWRRLSGTSQGHHNGTVDGQAGTDLKKPVNTR